MHLLVQVVFWGDLCRDLPSYWFVKHPVNGRACKCPYRMVAWCYWCRLSSDCSSAYCAGEEGFCWCHFGRRHHSSPVFYIHVDSSFMEGTEIRSWVRGAENTMVTMQIHKVTGHKGLCTKACSKPLLLLQISVLLWWCGHVCIANASWQEDNCE